MIATEERGAHEADRLLRRLIDLARVAELTVWENPRRRIVDAVLGRMRLFLRMTDKLGLAAPKSVLTWALLREAELDCMECREWRRCRLWLDGRTPGDEPNAFCPNHALFAALPRNDEAESAKEPNA
ncbi:MAG TPA: DUF6455 family protein [Candidatus Cybelea sp.]|nr:DUF6455 family protein [Candidatus Cybelea sp.]